MVPFAIHSAVMATTVLGQFAGKTALMSSVMMVPTVTSPIRMDVVQAQLKSVTIVKSGVHSGTLNAVKTITTLIAAFAHPTAPLA